MVIDQNLCILIKLRSKTKFCSPPKRISNRTGQPFDTLTGLTAFFSNNIYTNRYTLSIPFRIHLDFDCWYSTF